MKPQRKQTIKRSLFDIALPAWTIVGRATQRFAIPWMEGVDGSVFPLFSKEEFADQTVEVFVGLDPYLIQDHKHLLHIIKGVADVGAEWVSVDAGLTSKGAKFFAIDEVLRVLTEARR